MVALVSGEGRALNISRDDGRALRLEEHAVVVVRLCRLAGDGAASHREGGGATGVADGELIVIVAGELRIGDHARAKQTDRRDDARAAEIDAVFVDGVAVVRHVRAVHGEAGDRGAADPVIAAGGDV